MAKSVKKKPARKANAAFMKPVTPSPALAEVVGSKPIPRTEVTKKLWGYIKKNGLQDKKKRTNINAYAEFQKARGSEEEEDRPGKGGVQEEIPPGARFREKDLDKPAQRRRNGLPQGRLLDPACRCPSDRLVGIHPHGSLQSW